MITSLFCLPVVVFFYKFHSQTLSPLSVYVTLIVLLLFFFAFKEWAGGVMVLGKLPVQRRLTNFDGQLCLQWVWVGVCLDIFSLVCHLSLLSPSLWEKA